MPVNLFIDTNVYLSFYHLSGEDLEELKKLSVLLENSEIVLLLPAQVVEEFRRNRAAKIADALKGLRDQKLNFQFPQLCKDYAEYEQLRGLQREYERTHAELLSKITGDVDTKRLGADEIIGRLFELGKSIPIDDDLMVRARLRMDRGNPPGKNGSMGDAINWEALLTHAPDHDALHFVTDDRDYSSPLDAAAFNGFLLEEWATRKRGALVSHKRLSEFFKKEFPQIRLASEIEKELLIQKLANSKNFASTHTLVAKLRGLSDFSVAQSNAILSAAVSNNQVGWIIGDDDVRSFIQSLIAGRIDQLDQEALRAVEELLDDDEENGEDF